MWIIYYEKTLSKANWVTCPNLLLSITGFCILLDDFDFLKIGYGSIVATASELSWLQQLLRDFYISAPGPAMRFGDNQVVVHIAHNFVFREHYESTLRLIIIRS